MKVLGSPSVARLALTTLVALSVLPVMSGLVHAEFQGQLRVLALRDQLSANSIEDRRNAIRELTKMEGHAAIATDALLELLADPQLGSDVQKALLAIGPTALSKLGEHLQHADASRRVAALQCIATFGRYGRRVETSVVAALGDKEANVQVAALRVLTRLHPANSAVIPNLLQQLSHEDSQRRELAAITLREMGLRAKSTVPELAIALGDKSPRVRALTSEALGRMGPYARPALPACLPCLLTAIRQSGRRLPVPWRTLGSIRAEKRSSSRFPRWCVIFNPTTGRSEPPPFELASCCRAGW